MTQPAEAISHVTVEQVLNLALALNASEQARLLTRLAAVIEQTVVAKESSVASARRSARGLLEHLGPTPSVQEIDEARREMWGGCAAVLRDEELAEATAPLEEAWQASGLSEEATQQALLQARIEIARREFGDLTESRT